MIAEKAKASISPKLSLLLSRMLDEVTLRDSVAINFNQGMKNIPVAFLFNALMTCDQEGVKHLGGCLKTFGANLPQQKKSFLQ